LYARHIVWQKGVFRVDYRRCRCSLLKPHQGVFTSVPMKQQITR
jgi:hypothetical protein